MIPECGDGAVEGSEECDDGNTTSCDGCSATCTTEVGYVCGDGVLNQACGEECDDGNNLPGDGCDANCESELCGDGSLDAGEECDDGNTTSCDGCSATCTTEVGYVCGDGALNPVCGEECDDGNTTSCDGCSATCTTEVGTICGDGVLNQVCGEECDDGNTVPGDGCDANCQLEAPLLDLNGEYSIDIDTTIDTCGFGSGSSSTPMEVIEQTQTAVTVNIPIGGAGGECNREPFDRQGNTVTSTASSNQDIGPCTVLVEVTTSLTFFGDDTVTGFESNVLTAAGGDCSGITLPCEVQLVMAGARCSGCFSCVTRALRAREPGLGLLGSGAGATLDKLQRQIGAADPAAPREF